MILRYHGIYILTASEDICWKWKVRLIFNKGFDWKGFTIT